MAPHTPATATPLPTGSAAALASQARADYLLVRMVTPPLARACGGGAHSPSRLRLEEGSEATARAGAFERPT